jgi:hypothetical protein
MMARTGDRIRLVRVVDDYTKLRSGIHGTVTGVDDLGTVHVRWDDGSNLGLIPGVDAWETVDAALIEW